MSLLAGCQWWVPNRSVLYAPHSSNPRSGPPRRAGRAAEDSGHERYSPTVLHGVFGVFGVVLELVGGRGDLVLDRACRGRRALLDCVHGLLSGCLRCSVTSLAASLTAGAAVSLTLTAACCSRSLTGSSEPTSQPTPNAIRPAASGLPAVWDWILAGASPMADTAEEPAELNVDVADELDELAPEPT
jgi:hypothetical protein